MDEAGSSQQCLVCSMTINSTRFGMDVCRACSSFFKRAKISRQKFTCRQGNGKCATVKDDSFTCRGCRFERCIVIGMEWDGPMRIRQKKTTYILNRIQNELKTLIERRREQELKIIQQHGGHEKLSHPTNELYTVHQETCMEIYRIFINESSIFFNNVFPDFSQLPDRDQELIFKEYIGKMGMVEGLQRTLQLWGGVEKYQMFSVMTCYDVERLPLNSSEENAKSLASSSKSYAVDQLEILIPIFNKCSFTDQEFYALMALVMSELDVKDELTEAAEKIIDKYRRETLEDLNRHYQKDLGLKDYSERLGKLMSASYAIQESSSLFKQFYRFYSTVFDVFTTENVITKFHL